MVTFVSKIDQSGKMSDLFYNSAHTYLENELSRILKTTREIVLTPLSGGKMGTIYQFVNPENGMMMVVKVEDFKDVHYDAQLAFQVCTERNIPYPNLLHLKIEEYQGVKLTIQVMEKINLPTLSEYIQENPSEKPLIRLAGEMLRKIHSQPTERYGLFISNSLVGSHQDLVPYMREVYLKEELRNIYVSAGFLKKEVVDRLWEILTDPIELKKQEPVFSHGDVHLGNCFYDKQKNEVMFFDYSPKSMPIIFDLAVLKHKVLSKNSRQRWQLFKEGYGENEVDEKLLDLMIAYFVFRRAIEAWETDTDRAIWGFGFLQRFVTEYSN